MTTKIHDLLTKIGACPKAIAWADQWAASGSPKTAWEACERSDWMLWLLERTTLDENDPRYRLIACDCAEEALKYARPQDLPRLKNAIRVARLFARGRATRGQLATASSTASSAAYSAACSAASSAARKHQSDIIRKYFPKCPPLKPQ